MILVNRDYKLNPFCVGFAGFYLNCDQKPFGSLVFDYFNDAINANVFLLVNFAEN